MQVYPWDVPPNTKDGEMKSGRSCASSLLEFIIRVSATFLLGILARSVLVIFNITLIVSSLKQWEDFGYTFTHRDTVPRLKDVFVETMGPIGQFTSSLLDLMITVADHVNFLLQWEWECGGILALLEWLLLVTLLFALFLFMSTNVFMWISITTRKFKQNKPPIIKAIILLVNSAITQIVYMLLQVAVLTMHHVAVSLLFDVKGECSFFDRILLLMFARFIGILTALWALLFFFELVGGADIEEVFHTIVVLKFTRVKSEEVRALIRGLKAAARRITLLTFGLWIDELSNALCITETAEDFDDDPDDEDNCHELVMILNAKLRTVLWLFIPMFVFLAKIGEAMNTPPPFVFADDLFPITPTIIRSLYCVLNFTTLIVVITIVFYTRVLVMWALWESVIVAWSSLWLTQFLSACYTRMEKASRGQLHDIHDFPESVSSNAGDPYDDSVLAEVLQSTVEQEIPQQIWLSDELEESQPYIQVDNKHPFTSNNSEVSLMKREKTS